MEWARFEFDFTPSTADLDVLDVKAEEWKHGIQVDTDQCKAMGMSERIINVLRNGSDYFR